MMPKKIWLPVLSIGILCSLVAGLLLSLGVFTPKLCACAYPSRPITVATSVYPLSYLSQTIIGSAQYVTTIVPSGVEPHDYEPTAQDIQKIYMADVFVYNGNGLDPWAKKLQPELEQQGKLVINLTSIVTPDNSNPHFWLDPLIMVTATETLRDAFISVSTKKNKDVPPEKSSVEDQNRGFTTRAATLIQDLKNIDSAYSNGLKTCNIRHIIAPHNAFAYLGQRYHFQTSVIMTSPEEEPSGAHLVDVMTLMKMLNIRYIFREPLITSKATDTVSQQTSAQVLILDPIEGLTPEGQKNGQTYLSLMNQNLLNLITAMECSV